MRQPEFLTRYSQSRGFVLGRATHPRFTPSGRVLFLRSGATDRTQSLYEWRGGRAVLLADPATVSGGRTQRLSPAEKARNERARQVGTGFTDFLPRPRPRPRPRPEPRPDRATPGDEQVLLPLAGRLFLLSLNSGRCRSLPLAGGVIDPHWSPDGRRLAYVRGHDLYMAEAGSWRERRLTSGGSVDVTHGVAEFVAQEEMGRSSGFSWSPDGESLVYEEADHRGVEAWYLSDPLHPDAEPQKQFYPRPGHRNVKARLWFLDLRTGAAARRLPWPSWAEYLAAVRWDKRGGLTVQLQDRAQQRLELLAWDPRRPELRPLLRQTAASWVPLNQEQPVWLDRQRFLFLGEREGRSKVCVWSGGVARTLDAGHAADVDELVGLSQDRSRVLVVEDSKPGLPSLRWIPVNGKDPAHDLAGGQGVTDVHLSERGDRVVAIQADDQTMPRAVVLQPGKPIEQLSDTALEPDGLPDLHFEEIGDYRTVWMAPRNGVSGRKLPVILEVYGGPTKVQVAHNARSWLLDQWLADQGFFVVSADNRGTGGRGRAWEAAVYGKFGSVPLHDQAEALQGLLARHPEMDGDRVGIWGWSFGGYLSAEAVLRRPDVFKAAVAGAPVTDWADYDSHYTERYMGLLPRAAAAYREAELPHLAPGLSRPLLLVHGSADDNVYYRNSLKLSEALLRAGKPHELLTLPGITHSFRPDVDMTRELWSRTLEFYRRHLGAGS